MNNKLKIVLFIFFVMVLFSCAKKKETTIPVTNSFQEADIKTVVEQESKDIKNEEKTRREVKNPLVFYKQYEFTPIEEINVNSVYITKNDDNSIKISYNDKEIISINDIGFHVNNIINLCEPYLQDRLFSSSFIIVKENNYYYALISFNKGFVKIYSLKESTGDPFYSGYSNYFFLEDTWISKNEYYDYKTFKTVPAEYDAEVMVINVETDEIIYSIDAKKLHRNTLLAIDKIQYEPDGFRVTIGNCMDSDEFVDFKLYTADDDFHYEIYDKYEYDR